MTTDSYSKIFSLEVLHSFFEKKICDCLLFEPAEITDKVMKRFGFIVRKKMNGFSVYCNTSQLLPFFFDYIKKATFENSFDFVIKTNDESFFLFTELPPGPEGQIDYSSEKISGIDAAGVVVLQPAYSQTKKGVVGNIRFCFDDILTYKKDKDATAFRIEFQSRSTQWQYYIVNKSSVHVENPAINGKLNISFDGPVNVNIPSGETAMLFTSANELLPLSAKPQFQLDLVNNKIVEGENERAGPLSARKILFKGLPWPDPGRIGLTELNGRQIFSSPMYIYL
jgi:hypothetical protein